LSCDHEVQEIEETAMKRVERSWKHCPWCVIARNSQIVGHAEVMSASPSFESAKGYGKSTSRA
jgi:hypothetical protein